MSDEPTDLVTATLHIHGRKLDLIERKLEDHDAQFERIDARFAQVDARFDAVDARFDAVDARFDAVDARFDMLEHNVTTALLAVREDLQTVLRVLGDLVPLRPQVRDHERRILRLERKPT